MLKYKRLKFCQQIAEIVKLLDAKSYSRRITEILPQPLKELQHVTTAHRGFMAANRAVDAGRPGTSLPALKAQGCNPGIRGSLALTLKDLPLTIHDSHLNRVEKPLPV